VLRFGERIERRIDLWDVSLIDGSAPDAEVDAVMRGIETLIRQPGSGPRKLRELRRWAAVKLAPSSDEEPQAGRRDDDARRAGDGPRPISREGDVAG